MTENTGFWAMLFRPFFALIVLGLVVLPIKIVLDKIIPDSKLKRFLFKKRGG